jgi:hypothetical protein
VELDFCLLFAPRGLGEPEILRSSSRQFCLTGVEAVQQDREARDHRDHRADASYAPGRITSASQSHRMEMRLDYKRSCDPQHFPLPSLL